MAVWPRFGYHSLYEAAVGDLGTLTPVDQAVFDALQTTNFEGVLRDLRTAAIVDGALGLDTTRQLERYASIRDALVAAVHAVHIPWPDVTEEALAQIKLELLRYDSIFTTNYDLLVCWAAMCDTVPGNIVDYFWSNPLVFDRLNVDVWGKVSKLLFLHGGLHLVRLSDGRTLKRTAQPGANLLDLFGQPLAQDPEAAPLFVSEGEAADKLAVIRSSDYLSFAFTTFAELDEPLVVFGNSLSAQDQHLVDIVQRRKAPIAVSVRDAAPRDISAAKAGIRNRLRNNHVVFFDAATHPLGDPDLGVS